MSLYCWLRIVGTVAKGEKPEIKKIKLLGSTCRKIDLITYQRPLIHPRTHIKLIGRKDLAL